MRGGNKWITDYVMPYGLLANDCGLGGIIELSPLGDFLIVENLESQFALCLFSAPDRLHGVVVRFRNAPVRLLKVRDRFTQVSAKHAEGLREQHDDREREKKPAEV